MAKRTTSKWVHTNNRPRNEEPDDDDDDDEEERDDDEDEEEDGVDEPAGVLGRSKAADEDEIDTGVDPKPKKIRVYSNAFTKLPGEKGFNAQATSIMRSRGIYYGYGGKLKSVCGEGAFAHQQAAAWLAGPETPIDRLLVVHRTGSGKTFVMIQILDEYFDDPRPKIIIFPNRELVKNFYTKTFKEDNRYKRWCEKKAKRERKPFTLSYYMEKTSMDGELHKRGLPGELLAPIRPFGYAVAGGSTVFPKGPGERPAAPIFKIMYDGQNPYSNKIVVMDEVHNLIRPPPTYDKRMIRKLERLRQALYSADNSVIVGLTATPATKDPQDGEKLLAVIKGRKYANAETNEGFVSYFNTLPTSLYPRTTHGTGGVTVLRVALLRDNEKKYLEKAKHKVLSQDPDTRIGQIYATMNYCNMAGYYTQAYYGTFKDRMKKDPAGMATKLNHIIDDIMSRDEKCAVLIHRRLGWSCMKVLAQQKDPKNEHKFIFVGKPKTKKEEKDNPQLNAFNDMKKNARGEEVKCAILDIETFAEGIDLLGVRRLYLAHPAPSYSAYKQWIGRVYRACGYETLMDTEREVAIDMYVAKLVDGTPTADEMMLQQLRKDTVKMEGALFETFGAVATDRTILGHP